MVSEKETEGDDMYHPPIKVNAAEPAARLMKASFPDYRGRKYRIVVTEGPISLNSHWAGGSRDYFQVVRLADGAAVTVPQNGSGFEPASVNQGLIPALQERLPAPGIAVVEHSIFCGKDIGLTLHVHPSNFDSLRLTA